MSEPSDKLTDAEKKVRKARKDYYNRRVNKGLCTFCGRTVAPNYTICLWHLEKRRAMHGNKPWCPGGPGRPPRGIEEKLIKMKRAASKKLREDLLKLAAKQGLGEQEAPAFLKAYKKRIREKMARDPKAEIVMEEMLRAPEYEEMMGLVGSETAAEYDKLVREYNKDLLGGTDDETVGDDSGVQEADGAGGGGSAGGPGNGQNVPGHPGGDAGGDQREG